jgi:hypothetical protein
MALNLAPVHIRAIDRRDITAEDDAQTRILAKAIIQEIQRIDNAQIAPGNQLRFFVRLPSE